MGNPAGAEPVEIVVHDSVVIMTGFGKHHLILTPQAAERMAAKLSAAAFAAGCAVAHGVVDNALDDAEWTRAGSDSSCAEPRRRRDGVGVGRV